MLRLLPGIIIASFLLSCHHDDSNPESPHEKTGDSSFVHIVFFEVSDSLDLTETEEIINALKRLKEIDLVHDFSAGLHLDVGEKRSLADYGICMQMRFETRSDYLAYQRHPLHLELKKNVAHYLKSSPRTYDYTIN